MRARPDGRYKYITIPQEPSIPLPLPRPSFSIYSFPTTSKIPPGPTFTQYIFLISFLFALLVTPLG